MVKKKKNLLLFKKPKFEPKDRFIDGMIHDPESYSVFRSAIDVLLQMRSKLPNQFASYIQIYASLIKTQCMYEGMLKGIYKLSPKEFEYIATQIREINVETVSKMNFKAVEKRIDEKRAKVANMQETDNGLSYVVTQDGEPEKKEKHHDYIG